jgi:hypothetical protein
MEERVGSHKREVRCVDTGWSGASWRVAVCAVGRGGDPAAILVGLGFIAAGPRFSAALLLEAGSVQAARRSLGAP